MENATIHFVIENHTSIEEATSFAYKLMTLIATNVDIKKVEPHSSLKHSFCVYLNISLSDDLIVSSNQFTESICSPWVVSYHNIDALEMIFKKSKQSTYSDPDFSCIKWGHLQTL